MLAPGQTIDRYELLRPIGEGGMAHVWAARQRGKHGFEKLVALKIIHSRFAEDASFRAMFLDEARIVASIEHRNVGQLLDLGESGPLLYLVMEYIDGDSLFALIAPERRLPAPIAMRIAADVCAGLDAVHRLTMPHGRGQPRNVVHRDVSPHNILLSRSGDVKLIDFGIAHARDRSAFSTDIGRIKGKVRYMAPEQVRREPLGPTTDIFAVGAVLFRMIAGRAPYAGVSDLATLQALSANAPPLTRLPEDLPSPVVSIIQRAIALNPRDRYVSASDMQAALEAALSRAGQVSARDLAKWLEANLTDQARDRRRALASTGGRASESDAGIAVPNDAPPGVRDVGDDISTTGPTDPAVPQPAPANIAGAPHDLPPEGDRSFMDVGALVAQARANATAPMARPMDPRPMPRPLAEPKVAAGTMREHATPQPAPVQAVDANANGPRYVGPTTPAARGGRATSGAVFKLSILVIALVLVTLCVLFLLPMVVRDRIIASAREAGFELTVEHVGVGFDGVTLRNVGVKAQRTPGITATIPNVYLNGLTGKDVRIHEPQLKLSGSRSDIEVGLAAIVADARTRFAGTPTGPRHLSLIGTRLTWDGIAGEGSRLSASDIGAEIDSRGPGAEDIRGSVGRFELATKQTTVGPWASAFETSPTGSRIRVMLDPPVPDGPSLLYVWGGAVPPELTLRIPRSPFANLGVKPEGLGLPATASTEIEAKIEGKFPPGGTSTVHGTVSLWGAQPKGHAPVNIKAVGSATGAADKPLELEKTIVLVGPFSAGVSGNVALHDRGIRLDAVFKSLPMTCASLAKDQAKNMGPFVEALQAIGQSTGALRVTGNVNVSGVVKYDTAEPEEANVTWLAKETCGVSIFGL
jgi:serine/threonine protein kinase